MKIIYSKINGIERKEKFQIETKILKDSKGVYVLKCGLHSNDHIDQIYQNSLLLKEIYENEIVLPTKQLGGLLYPFIEGITLEKMIEEGRVQEALSIYKKLLNAPSNLTTFKMSASFQKLFPNVEIKEGTRALKIPNIDLLFSNIIIDEKNRINIIDCEWVYNFILPLDFIIYRAVKELKSHLSYVDENMIYEYLGLSLDLNTLEQMDNLFIKHVFKEGLTPYKNNYIFNAIDDASKEVNRLNGRIDELGEWGEKLNQDIASRDETIINEQDKVRSLEEEKDQLHKHLVKLDDEIEQLNKEVKIKQDAILSKEKLIIEKDLIIKTKEDELLNKDLVISNKEQIILDKENIIRNRDEEIMKKDQAIKNKEQIILDKEEHIHLLNQNIEDLNDQINSKRQEINNNYETISRMDHEIQERNEHIQKLDNQIVDEDHEIQRLNGELNQIKNSTSYRFLLKYYKVRDFFFPKNSKRRLVAKLMVKALRHPIWFIKHLTPTNIKKFFKYRKSEGLTRAIERVEIYKENNTVVNSESNLILESMKEMDEYPILTFKKVSKPLVSIVIPVYNQFPYTYGCLQSILKHTDGIDYEVIIADDCSTDKTQEIKDIAKNIVVVRNKKNLRFLLNCNNAAKHAKGKYILFLNNDTNVQPNWLDSLLETISMDESIGMVGSKLVYPNGMLQEAGGILWRDGSAWNYGNKSDKEASEYNYRKEADYISGAAIMIKASLWKEIGGFDELFVPAYCEDSDLAFEVRKRNYKVVYDPFSVVVHYEGISNGTDVTQGLKKYQVENSKKFYEKWKDVLAKHYPNAENVFVARERSFDKKTLLMIDHYVPQFDKDAGSRTIYAYLKLFVAMGYNVKFMGENFYRHEPYTEALQKLGIEVLYGPYYASNWKEWLKLNGKNIDLVFFNRPHITKKFIDDVEPLCPNAKYIYYGHDLHYVRMTREAELKKDKKLLEEANKWKQIEFDIFHKVDMVMYPSQVEIDLIKKELPDLNAKVLQPYIYDEFPYKKINFANRKDIMFVGGFRHSPNFDGIMWFIKEIFPELLKKHKDMKLYVAGSFPPQELMELASDNIIVTGFVSDEKLLELYNQVKIIVVPLRYGAGIKGKVIEAMANLVPVVTTECGAEGIYSDALVVDETLLKINELYDDNKELLALSKKEYKFIMDEYSKKSAMDKLEEDISKLY